MRVLFVTHTKCNVLVQVSCAYESNGYSLIVCFSKGYQSLTCKHRLDDSGLC